VSRSIYVTSAEGDTGKSTVALGLVDLLTRSVQRVGVFRPIARSTATPDYVLELLLAHDGVDLTYADCIGVTYEQVHADPEAALAEIVQRYHAVERQCDVVVIVGTDYTDVAGPTELSYNARIAANLGAPVLLVVSGNARTPEVEQTPMDHARKCAVCRRFALPREDALTRLGKTPLRRLRE
jgi:phosphate acetyltransferase